MRWLREYGGKADHLSVDGRIQILCSGVMRDCVVQKILETAIRPFGLSFTGHFHRTVAP